MKSMMMISKFFFSELRDFEAEKVRNRFLMQFFTPSRATVRDLAPLMFFELHASKHFMESEMKQREC